MKKQIFSIALVIVLTLALCAGLFDGFTDSSHASSFTPRTSAPLKNNVYYWGGTGYNPFNNGVLDASDGYGNCTWYAWGRAYEIMGTKPKLSTSHAKDWYGHKDGYSRGSTPKIGAIACWGANSQNVYGHVAVVEKIEGNNVTVSESIYAGAAFQTALLSSKGSGWGNFQGYIYLGDFETASTPTLPRTDITAGTYYVKYGSNLLNVNTTSAPKSENDVMLHPFVSGDIAMEWTFEKIGDAYLMRSGTRGVVLNVWGTNAKNGDKVNVYNYTANDNCQLWYLSKVGDKYAIFSKSNAGLALTATGTMTVAGKSYTTVKVQTYTGAANQLWAIESMVSPVKTYTVTFKDHNGATLKTQTVNAGTAAIAPANPSRAGYTFKGWDRAFTNVTTDMTVTARYEEIVVISKPSETSPTPENPPVTSPAPPEDPPARETETPPWRESEIPPVTKEQTPSKNENPYTDISRDDWYYDAVIFVYDQNLMIGMDDGKFSPMETLTREQAITIIARLAGDEYLKYAGQAAFDDVAANRWSAGAVAWARATGVTNGIGGNKFDPTSMVTLDQFEVMLMRHFDLREQWNGNTAASRRADSAWMLHRYLMEYGM